MSLISLTDPSRDWEGRTGIWALTCMAPGFQKLWAISKKYGPWQLWDGPEVKEKKYWYFSKGCIF